MLNYLCLISSIFLILLILCKGDDDKTKFFSVPMQEVLQNSLYLALNEHNEMVVTFSGRGSDLRPDDYLTHADGIRILSGGLDTFLSSGEREVIVPVVDNEDIMYGGSKFLGFVLMKAVIPRKLSSRRGEIIFDLEEGGPAPSMQLGNLVITSSGAKSTSDGDYIPPPNGGGKCITSRDCYNFNGTCVYGECKCNEIQTGSYCQLYRPQSSSITNMVKTANNKINSEFITNNKPKLNEDTKVELKKEIKTAPPPPPPPPEQNTVKNIQPIKNNDNDDDNNNNNNIDTNQEEDNNNSDDGVIIMANGRKKKIKPGAKKKKKSRQNIEKEEPVVQIKAKDFNEVDTDSGGSSVTMDDLYGDGGRPYPEPFPAGKVPNDMVHQRHKSRVENKPFLYSVRFRSGPFGMVFDNKIQDGTRIEKLIQGQQAAQSDIQVGDYLVAIDIYNTTTANAKNSNRILSGLPWPRVLVFESRGTGIDSKQVEANEKKRTFNVSLVYPPTLVSQFQVRVADWTPAVSVTSEDDVCPIYILTTTEDTFGCKVQKDSSVLSDSVKGAIQANGIVEDDLERKIPMLSMILMEAKKRSVSIKFKSVSVMKRGVCTFVEKAKGLMLAGADLGLIINTEDSLLDMPAGKENTSDCTNSIAIMKESDGSLLYMAAMKGEVLSFFSDSRIGLSPACIQAQTITDDIMDRWAHSVPHEKSSSILSNTPPGKDKLRGMTEEGGRLAVSGENGWAFFDYHLAMFGPQEVPLGPIRVVMAQPPYGCDPAAYTIRISGAVVAILRGGGCSFGIKVINAQKLGARAVIIVNTDDKATMRLMALPDEVPLIKIPCIMVSRRIQYYLEQLLKYYYLIDQHFVSIQPTGINSEYESRNKVILPQRID